MDSNKYSRFDSLHSSTLIYVLEVGCVQFDDGGSIAEAEEPNRLLDLLLSLDSPDLVVLL